MTKEPIHRPLMLERMKEAFEIDPTVPSGLRWKHPNCSRIMPGSPAGCLRPDGYHRVKFDSIAWLSHRIVWAITNSKDPGKKFIDHIDHNRQNNAPENLRLVTKRENAHNSINQSKYGPGIAMRAYKTKNSYCPQIAFSYNGIKVRVNLGSIGSLDEARELYRESLDCLLSLSQHFAKAA